MPRERERFLGKFLSKKIEKGLDKHKKLWYNGRALKEKANREKVFKKNLIFLKKPLDKPIWLCYNKQVASKKATENGSIAQLGEHLPYKQRVIGSSPIVSTSGPVAQLVRALACHARGRGFDPHPDRHYNTALAVCLCSSVGRAGD